jgi:hypothetical protein
MHTLNEVEDNRLMNWMNGEVGVLVRVVIEVH